MAPALESRRGGGHGGPPEGSPAPIIALAAAATGLGWAGLGCAGLGWAELGARTRAGQHGGAFTQSLHPLLHQKLPEPETKIKI